MQTNKPIYQATPKQALKHLSNGGLVTIADTHLGAPHAIHDYQSIKNLLDKGAIGLGDLIDLANCEKSDAKMWHQRLIYLAAMTEYVFGNHGIVQVGAAVIVKNKKAFTHSHLIYWSAKKVERWTNKSFGKKFWRFQIYRLKHLKDYKLRQLKVGAKEWEKFHAFARETNVTDIYIGHTHRYLEETHIDESGHKVTLHATPRGITLH